MNYPEQVYNEDMRRHFHELIDHFSRSEQNLARINRLASTMCNSSVSLINFVDDEYQYTVSSTGNWEDLKIPIDQSFCFHTLSEGDFLVIDNTQSHDLTKHVQSLARQSLQFYAGVPIPNSRGMCFGTLCVLNQSAIELTDIQKNNLKLLAEQLQYRFESFLLQKDREKLVRNLREKDTLFREIHHRIKNNLGDICGILQIQWFETDNHVVRNILSKAEARIVAVIKLHEILYESEDFVQASLKKYLSRLINTIRQVSGSTATEVAFELHLEDIPLDMNQSMSVGLIVNELTTNAIQHAFHEREEGTIQIEVREKNQGKVHLTVRDNGTGIDLEEKNLSDFANMGLKLIDLLVQQLNGVLKVQSDHKGTVFELEFSMETKKSKNRDRKAAYT